MPRIWKNGTKQDCFDNDKYEFGWCGVCNKLAKEGEIGKRSDLHDSQIL